MSANRSSTSSSSSTTVITHPRNAPETKRTYASEALVNRLKIFLENTNQYLNKHKQKPTAQQQKKNLFLKKLTKELTQLDLNYIDIQGVVNVINNVLDYCYTEYGISVKTIITPVILGHLFGTIEVKTLLENLLSSISMVANIEAKRTTIEEQGPKQPSIQDAEKELKDIAQKLYPIQQSLLQELKEREEYYQYPYDRHDYLATLVLEGYHLNKKQSLGSLIFAFFKEPNIDMLMKIFQRLISQDHHIYSQKKWSEFLDRYKTGDYSKLCHDLLVALHVYYAAPHSTDTINNNLAKKILNESYKKEIDRMTPQLKACVELVPGLHFFPQFCEILSQLMLCHYPHGFSSGNDPTTSSELPSMAAQAKDRLYNVVRTGFIEAVQNSENNISYFDRYFDLFVDDIFYIYSRHHSLDYLYKTACLNGCDISMFMLGWDYRSSSLIDRDRSYFYAYLSSNKKISTIYLNSLWKPKDNDMIDHRDPRWTNWWLDQLHPKTKSITHINIKSHCSSLSHYLWSKKNNEDIFGPTIRDDFPVSVRRAGDDWSSAIQRLNANNREKTTMIDEQVLAILLVLKNIPSPLVSIILHDYAHFPLDFPTCMTTFIRQAGGSPIHSSSSSSNTSSVAPQATSNTSTPSNR